MKTFLSYLYDEEYGDITDVDEGSDITIERSGQGLDTSYNVKIARKLHHYLLMLNRQPSG